MKTKQILCGVLVALMLISSCFNVCAANVTTDGARHDALITYGLTDSFIVTIPSEIYFDENGEASAEVVATNVIIPYGAQLYVDLRSNNDWYLMNNRASEDMVYYEAWTDDGLVSVMPTVLSVNHGDAYNKSISNIINFNLEEEITSSGTYQDILTFDVYIYVEKVSFQVGIGEGDDGIFAEAEVGMTWYDWFNSKYSKEYLEYAEYHLGEIYVDEYGPIGNETGMQFTSWDMGTVDASDLIAEGHYFFMV